MRGFAKLGLLMAACVLTLSIALPAVAAVKSPTIAASTKTNTQTTTGGRTTAQPFE